MTGDNMQGRMTNEEFLGDLRQIQQEVGEWAEENFGTRFDILRSIMIRNGVDPQIADEAIDSIDPLSAESGSDLGAMFCTEGVGEENGELMHSVLKRAQGIRLDEDEVGPEAEQDAVGDIIIYLADFCYRRGYDIADCVEMAWYGEVSEREWDSDTRQESDV